MHNQCLAVALNVLSIACAAAAGAGQPAMIDEIMADTAAFATSIDSKLRRPDDKGSTRAIETVLPNVVNPSGWRFHARHGGLLVAIPVTRNLTAAEKYGGESEIIDVVERLIRQRGISGRIEVVFIEPAALERVVRVPVACCVCQPVAPPPSSACSCW